MEFEEQLGLMPLECLNVKEQLGLMPLECLKLEDEHWKDHILNSLLSILWLLIEPFDVCVFVLGIPTLSQIEEPLPWAPKREGSFQELHLIVVCLSLPLLCLLIPKDGSYLDHQYNSIGGFASLSLTSCMPRTLAILLLPSTLTQAKTFVKTLPLCFQTLET